MNNVCLLFLLFFVSLQNAQEVRVIDNKGTMASVRNTRVYTSATPPTSPIQGDVWFDTATNISKIRNDSAWLVIDADNVTTSASAPTTPTLGDIWFDSNSTPSISKVYNGSIWVALGNNRWSLSGNASTDPSINFLGTTDAQDLILKTNNSEKLKIHATKNQVLVNQATSFSSYPLALKANGTEALAFQNSAGTTKWNFNILSTGFSLGESGVFDHRLHLGIGGKVGINTNNPSAMLDINTEIVPSANIVPLKITPNATTPTGTSSGQFHVGSDGLLYTYDANRGKWLSVDRIARGWGASGLITNLYINQFSGATSALIGWRMLRKGTITGITAQTGSIKNFTILIRRNGTNDNLVSTAVNNSTGGQSNTINADFNEGDYLQCGILGTDISNPQVIVEIAWRRD